MQRLHLPNTVRSDAEVNERVWHGVHRPDVPHLWRTSTLWPLESQHEQKGLRIRGDIHGHVARAVAAECWRHAKQVSVFE